MQNKVLYDLSDRTNMFYWQTNRKISPQDMKKIFLDRRNTVSEKDTKAAIEYGMMQAGKSKKCAKVVKMGKPIPNGSVNNVLKATLADNTEVMVRMHPYFVQNGYFWVEKIATIEAKRMGVPTYETYFIDDSKDKFDFDYMIMEALPGKTLQDFWPLEPRLDHILMRETGKYTAMIHQVKPRGFGFFKNQIVREEERLQGQYATFRDHFYAGLEEDFMFLVDQKVINNTQRRATEKIFETRKELLDIQNPSLIHNDIADWNQLSDGEHITGMIDWDECFSGDPVMDFAQWSLFFDDKRQKYFIEGYKEISPLPDGYFDKEHVFRLRYLISKLHLRKKRAMVLTDSTFMNQMISRGMSVMKEEFKYFGI